MARKKADMLAITRFSFSAVKWISVTSLCQCNRYINIWVYMLDILSQLYGQYSSIERSRPGTQKKARN